MADLYNNWCDLVETATGKKKLWRFTEKKDGREEILSDLSTRVLSHYVSDEDVAVWLENLGYETTAACIREEYPVGSKGKSADLGEILASELVEEELGYVVPVKKLRDKDHREMAMRGEDNIAVGYDSRNRLKLLKGESKSARKLAKSTVQKARAGLESNHGRPSAHSMIFIGRRLINSTDPDEKQMGIDLMNEAVNSAIPKTRIGHFLFTMSGNQATESINTDFTNADAGREQFSVNLRIVDHGDFVSEVFEEALKIGNE